MDLTIAEVAHAVGKTDNYVRQHIHRKHLTARKDGRNVSVALDDAVRWARKRGLTFEKPVSALVAVKSMKGRVARMTVLVWQEPNATPRNLFTLVRHRREEALGPWASVPDATWSNDDLGHGLRLFTFDATLELCQVLLGRILDSGTLEINGVDIDYALHLNPRCHWAYRDERPLTDASVRSPFSRHSAEVIEYWSFREEFHNYWLEILKSPPKDLPSRLKCLGFPLDQRPERVGNLMIAGAEDTNVFDLAVHQDRTLRLHVEACELLLGAYRATVWGSHCGDEVIRQEFLIEQEQTVIKLASDVDHIGFAIFRTEDRQCIDLMEAYLIMEVGGSITVSSPTLHFENRKRRLKHEVTPAGPKAMIDVRFDDNNAKIDKEIRRQFLDYRANQREATARKEGQLIRFQPSEYERAVKYFVYLLGRGAHQTEPLYLADPYFMFYLDESKKENADLVQLYLEMFAATTGQSLKILSAQSKHSNQQPWWLNYPKNLMSHVSVRSFLKHNTHDRRGFHDRYLITPECEILITNSLNGWSKHGVTFASHSYGVYRAEAEMFWSINLQSTTEPFFVEEVR